MSPPVDTSGLPRPLARYTPDSRRWRRRVAGLAAVGAMLSLYATFAIVSGVKSGIVYNLLALLFGTLTLLLPVVATTTVFAPDSGLTRPDDSRGERPVETLKRRYAAGEIDRDEFERRLDDLMAASDDAPDRSDADSVERSGGRRATRDAELDSAGQ
ncbi:SHOCT domain-containing protein [Halorussus limi]|uniref:SHOCT domain-containing protein n=1 Tax=Halorussus limi TaxID=2938695 RepID=A0A8U0HTJ3_9EURY|nr:SHOCT domain-containing protein [Halorussus limi]UPV74016.1 SHOCT domain-containing protein [Halorussus limi]